MRITFSARISRGAAWRFSLPSPVSFPPTRPKISEKAVPANRADTFSPIVAAAVDRKSRPADAWESNPVRRREDLPATTTFQVQRDHSWPARANGALFCLAFHMDAR